MIPLQFAYINALRTPSFLTIRHILRFLSGGWLLAVTLVAASMLTLKSYALDDIATSEPGDTKKKGQDYELEIIAEDLNFPWSISFPDQNNFLLTLRSGSIIRINADGESTLISGTPESYVAGQGGYFDLMLDRDYQRNQTLWLSYAYGSKKQNYTRVARAKLVDDALVDFTVVFTTAPSKNTSAHYGGRLAQLPDGTITLTTGDGFNFREAAQDTDSHLGKIVRFTRDGNAAADNPYNSSGGNSEDNADQGNEYVYALGLRSPQGLFFDKETDTLFVHGHGPKGGDELNIVKAGTNYGWPLTSYGVNYSGARVSPYTSLPGIEEPIKYWTPSIAPSGLTLYRGDAFPGWDGSMMIGALVDRDVKRLKLADGKVVEEESLFAELGARIRDVRTGPDGMLYLLTDSRDGKLVRVRPGDN